MAPNPPPPPPWKNQRIRGARVAWAHKNIGIGLYIRPLVDAWPLVAIGTQKDYQSR